MRYDALLRLRPERGDGNSGSSGPGDCRADEKVRTQDLTKDLSLTGEASALCPNCGARTQGGKFCPECGQAIRPKNECPKCGTKAEPGSKFCPECGGKLG